EALIAGAPGISAYQATVGGQSDPFAPPGTVPADPTQAAILVVQNGQYDGALAGVKHALSDYHGPAKLQVGQAQNSSNASSSQMLAGLVAQQINGQVAAQANLPQGTMLVRVQLPPGTADTAATLSALPIPTAFGVVPLSTLATIRQVSGPQTVNRVNGDRDATITGTITANDT